MGQPARSGRSNTDADAEARCGRLTILQEEQDALREAWRHANARWNAQPTAENLATIRRVNREMRWVLAEIAALLVAPVTSHSAPPDAH